MLGHSFGQVALKYALRYQERVSRLLLGDTSGDAWWSEEGAPMIWRKCGYSAATAAAARRFFNGDLRPDEASHIAMKFMRAYFYRLGPRDLRHTWFRDSEMKMRHDAHVFGSGTLLKS